MGTPMVRSGSQSMLESVRRKNLDKFRHGEVGLLVSTNTLEEGIDVPDCDVVICFDKFDVTKAVLTRLSIEAHAHAHNLLTDGVKNVEKVERKIKSNFQK